MFYKKVKYYDSADVIPIGRYMLATCRDLRYFAIGELPKKLNNRRLKKAVTRLNKTILKDSEKAKIHKDLHALSKDEAGIYLHSTLIAIVDYADALIERGVDKNVVLKKLTPIKPLLLERGLSADTRKNAKRLDKITRNFVIKSDEIKNRLKNEKADKDEVYKNYLQNLILIERTFGVKIDEQRDSLNKYVMLIDQIKAHANRLK